ncbi:MAG: restriction endonuclease [Gemmatimonadetes bacterium]|nr:restriction endonuclease [Gemmatimonadota bacterium]
MTGQLFTHYFLTDGIKTTPEWQASVDQPEAFAAFRNGVARHHDALSRSRNPNEARTEEELIRPVLELLGWTEYVPQPSAAGHEDIPDHLLFADADSKARAGNPFQYATVVEESKRFGLALDSRDRNDRAQRGTPHGQILRYLATAEIESEGRIRWGILTNGSVWRLYDYRARPRASGFFEADLAELLQPGKEDDLRVFHLLFRRESFTLRDGATTTFLEEALAEGRRYEEQVAQDLSGVVFERVFPNLVNALVQKSEESLVASRDAALIFLYRLLFVLYAEDRGLLPVNDERYDDYGLRKPVRDDIASRMAADDTYSAIATNYYDHLTTLFKLIDKGDESIGLPPYNGGLFAAEAAPLLETVRLADEEIAPIIYDLSHTEDSQGVRRFVNYRDMSVQQLGSIYERLLEREPVRDDNGNISIRPNPYARKDSGSFYTSQELVDLIVERTLKPLAEERLQAFEDKAAELKSERRSKQERREELEQLDPAEAVLDLKVLDPAMGSGHFLVTAVDFLSDYIAELIEFVPSVPEWLDGEYASPLVGRVAAIREDIRKRADESNWVLDEAQLTDQAIIRRMVLKRCIYGVDKNRLTVELAKVSLWLHSFTVGAPLSFLDHHLRCGDSLVGLRVRDATDELNRLGGMFASSAIASAETATDGMQLIEEMSDADVAEVQESAELFGGVEETTADLRGLLDFLCGWRWLTAGMKKKERDEFEGPLVTTLGYHAANAYELLARGPEEDISDFAKLWHEATSIANREGFLHWEVAFPGVWHRWQESRPQGGFDAIIGNPPWDQIEQPEVEWFATRDEEIAHAATGARRKALIKQKKETGDKLVLEYETVRNQATAMREFIRSSDEYPLLSGGRINLYSLFVERAMSLIKPDGFVGLLTPSGIYADKTAARFFKSVSTSGRVSGLFDFENKRIFFKDIHASFKFCALIFGGEERRFDQTECAFFLHDTKTIDDEDRCFPLTPDDFARVNPNTGTAPVFRTRRDADVTRGIYERRLVMVDSSGSKKRRAWRVLFMQGLFNMTSDSHLFRTAAQLDTEGFYPVEGNRWKKGEEVYLPLYEGKMVQAFDHRAASVVVNPENLNRPGQPREATPEEHANPNWLPNIRYFVDSSHRKIASTRGYILTYKRITAATNVRTMIAAVGPHAAYEINANNILLPTETEVVACCCIVSCLNSMAFDYVVRQKIQGVTLNWYIVEQLPLITPDAYNREFGATTARDLVRDHVLRLTYTAHDMAPFARDLGYDGEPFIWDEEERRHLRARLDALYFHLYGLSRDDAEYVLDTFPIVRREDEATFGTYRTRDMTLAYMNALAAGDTETRVAV